MAFWEGIYPRNLVLGREGLLIEAEVRKGSEGGKQEGKKGETGRKRRELETWFVQGGKRNFSFPTHQLTTNIKREK